MLNEESFFLLFLLISLSIQLTIPFSLRHLSNEDSFPMIYIGIYIGSPLTEYKLLYDTSSQYTVLISSESTLSHPNRAYDSYASNTMEICDRQNKLFIRDDIYGMGLYTKDKVTNTLSSQRTTLTFVFATEYYHPLINYNCDGIAGLNFQYSQLTFSLIDSLYISRSINKKVFAHRFINETYGEVYLGEDGITDERQISKMKQCSVKDDNWSCYLRSVSFNNEEVEMNKTTMFSTGSYFIEFPFKIIEGILGHYLELLNRIDYDNNCTIIHRHNYKDYIECEHIKNIEKLSTINFNFDSDVVITLDYNDMFIYSKENNKYQFVIQGNKLVSSEGKIGLIALKNYHTIFNKDKYSISFIPIKQFIQVTESPELFSGFIVGFLILITIVIIFCVVCSFIRKKRRTKYEFDTIPSEKLQEFSSLIS